MTWWSFEKLKSGYFLKNQLYGGGTIYGIKKCAVADCARYSREAVGKIQNNWSEICVRCNVLHGT